MPLIDPNDPAMWSGPTSLYGERGFTREWKQDLLGWDHILLAQALDLKPGQSIVLVGAAFGWMAEEWIAMGLGPVLALDTSTYIHQRKDTEARVPILKADPGNPVVLDALGGAPADWCISEDVVPILNDGEAVQLAFRMRSCATRAAHWISCGIRAHDDPNRWTGDWRLNWKTLEEWKGLLSPDTVVARNEMARVL